MSKRPSPQLSERQLQVAQLAANGYSNREIGSKLNLTEQIVKNVVHSVFDKLGIWNRVELANRFLKDRPTEVVEQVQRRIEAERLIELRRRQILDTKAEQAFDELTKVAVRVFNVPIALVALMDAKRLWFKSNIGLEVSQVPRELTICHHTIQQSQVLALWNAPEDLRFVCNPLVQEVGVRFYAAAPILTDDGYPLGVVCIVDRIPRQFDTAQLSVLTSLARLALQHIELRLELLEKSPIAEQANLSGEDSLVQRAKSGHLPMNSDAAPKI